MRFGVESRYFAAASIETELRFDALDFVERLLPRRPQPNGIFPVQQDLEPGRHGVAGHSD
jgi:hypothetical protein